MVKKDKFEEIGGFEENLPVAYNDVELCFKLLEKGYYNVLRNDVKLIHHESISRGYDEVTPEKAARQKKEMEYLYQLHPKFKGYDPCYNPNLVKTRGDFSLDLTKNAQIQEMKPCNKNIRVTSNIEYHIDELCMGDKVEISGWAFNKDKNKSEKVVIILIDDFEKQYELNTEEIYRPDVVESYKNKKLAFSGFQTMFDKQTIASGNYVVYLQLKDNFIKIVDSLDV